MRHNGYPEWKLMLAIMAAVVGAVVAVGDSALVGGGGGDW